MAGARDKLLEDQYDRLCGESSPYENIINKDIGRSFPGVEMFRDADGEGQKMLGRVLKCFSLHDDKIGYCQGLGFLVGPLLMQMGERDAFCVLVRLMEDYDLHSCFQPDLSGLHLCIYQFQELLTQHLPVLAAHLAKLQVEAAYLSQWFLSFFAVTCPLPMLFRIYDVIFAEGASETIMRVALSVMRRNEQRILALSEFEDVMQLLLSRALWDPYGLSARSADELVSDFVSFSSLVTRENLRELDARFKASREADSPTRSGFFPEAQNAASRFLGRLWAPSGTPTKPTSSTLSPDSATTPGATSRPSSFLRRTPSKQSLASTHTSTEAGSDSTMSPSSSGTALTSFSRITSDDYDTSVESPKMQSENLAAMATPRSDRDLHGQIEDLLTALSEMQRAHAQLAAQLAKEREEREEDCAVVQSLLAGLAREKGKGERGLEQESLGRRRTVPVTRGPVDVEDAQEDDAENPADAKRVSKLIASAEHRFPFVAAHSRCSSGAETKSQLRSALAQARENTESESMRAADLSQQLEARDQETCAMREQLREARARAQTEFSEKQRLEKTIAELRQELRQAQHGAGSTTGIVNRMAQGLFDQSAASTDSTAGPKQSQSNGDNNGLREFKLGRANTTMTPQQFSKRSSSLVTHAVLGSLAGSVPSLPSVPSAMSTASSDGAAPSSVDQQDRDAMLLELVNAKTAEAIARQELDEMKGRYESMRKMLGQQSPATPSTGSGTSLPAPTPGHKPRSSEGWVSYVSGAARDALASATVAATTTNEKIVTEEKPKAPASGGGFWGWGKRT